MINIMINNDVDLNDSQSSDAEFDVKFILQSNISDKEQNNKNNKLLKKNKSSKLSKKETNSSDKDINNDYGNIWNMGERMQRSICINYNARGVIYIRKIYNIRETNVYVCRCTRK